MVSTYKSAKDLLPTLKECDIIEFNRVYYSHYAFYIGNGICVHVEGPEKGGFSSSSSSSSFTSSSSSRSCAKGTKSARKLADIANGSPCRVRTFKLIAGVTERSKTEAIRLALNGLPKDEDGNVILGATIEVNYAVVSFNNCEGWATYWKYETKTGFSLQAQNGLISSSIGTVERVSEYIAYDMDKIASDPNEATIKRVGAAVGVVVYKPIGVAATGVRKATDIVSGGIGWLAKQF